jgi:spindle assembly abnormal protein 6
MAVVNTSTDNPYRSGYARAPTHRAYEADDGTNDPFRSGLSHTLPPSANGEAPGVGRQRSVPAAPAHAGVMTGLSAPVTHFDEEVQVHVRILDREEVSQPLGVAVASGTIGTARCVSVRVTDPRDPFFLYSMTLSENDYGRFKESHELHVDWNGFPQDLISLLSASRLDGAAHDRSTASAVAGGRGVTLRFVAQAPGGQQGTLRIMEPTAFVRSSC